MKIVQTLAAAALLVTAVGAAGTAEAYRYHHRTRVCHTEWHHHHRVRVCHWR